MTPRRRAPALLLLRAAAIGALALAFVLTAPLGTRAQISVTTPLPGVRMAHMVNGGRASALLVVDLCAAGIDVRTTRYEERGALASTWAGRTGVDVAINGDFFRYGSYAAVHYARSGGADWPAGTHDAEPHPNVAFGPGFVVRGELPPPAAATDVVGGLPEIVIGGVTNPYLAHDSFTDGQHRRTAIGISADRRTLFLFSTDGTLSVPGIHFAMAAMGSVVPGAPAIHWALNLDGGGSSQMWVRGVGTVIPSSRPVSNHLGLFARGSGPSPLCPAVEPLCPATGSGRACLDDTRIADCVSGVVTSAGDCAAYGARCSAAAPGGPRCVISACIGSRDAVPFEHDACMPDGQIVHCGADGTSGEPRACESGTECVTLEHDGMCAPPGVARPAGDGGAAVGPADAGVSRARASDAGITPWSGRDAGAGRVPRRTLPSGCSVGAGSAAARLPWVLLSAGLLALVARGARAGRATHDRARSRGAS